MIQTKSATRLLLQNAFSRPKELAVGIGITLAWTAVSLLPPMIVQHILDHELNAKTGILHPARFAQMLALYMAVLAGGMLLEYARTIHFKRLSCHIAFSLRGTLFDRAMRQTYALYTQTPIGKTTSRIISDTDVIMKLYDSVFTSFLSSGFYIVGIVIVLIFREPIALLMTVLPIVFTIALITIYKKFMLPIITKMRSLYGDIISDLNETLRGYKIVQAFSREEVALKRVEETMEDYRVIGRKTEFFDAFFSYGLNDTCNRLNTIFLIVLFIWGKTGGPFVMTIGTVSLLIQYSNTFFSKMNQIIFNFREFQRATAALLHAQELLLCEQEQGGTHGVASEDAEVVFDGVDFSYTEDAPVLRGVSFRVPAGSQYAIVGATGSGKSSILSLLFRLYDPQSGEIRLGGRPLTEYSQEALRSSMCFVPQDPVLFPMTLRDNITLGYPANDSDIRDALVRSGGGFLLDRLPAGLDTPLTGGGDLSLGEKQIVTFARAMLRSPRLLVLDEATASVDSATERDIQRGLENLMQGRTSIIVAHRLSTIRESDCILVLDHGEVVESGSHDDLMARGGLYANMVKTQAFHQSA